MQNLDNSQPEVEDAAVILARRQKEEEERIRLQRLLQDDHSVLKVSAEEEQCALQDILNNTDSGLDSKHDLACMPPGERVLGICPDRLFTADSLSLHQFITGKGQTATCCQHHLKILTSKPWDKETIRFRSVASAALHHECAFMHGFLRYLFFLTSVCEDRTILDCCTRELFTNRKGLLTAADFLTVLLNWGIEHRIFGFDFELSPEFQGAELGTTALQPDAADAGPPKPTVTVILGLMQNMLPTDTAAPLLLGLLRALFALLTDPAAHCCEIQTVIVYLMELIQAQNWPDVKLAELVQALNLQEINLQDRLEATKYLFYRNGPNPNRISSALAFAILQQIHGVPNYKVQYVSELHASQLLSMLPSLSYNDLKATQLYMSLDALMLSSAGVVFKDGNDNNFYNNLCQHLVHVKCEMGRLPVLDNQFIRILIGNMNLVWKVKAGSQSLDLPEYFTNSI